MKKAILILLCAALPGLSLASGGEHVKLDAVKIDLSDKASLQRGARTFVNYCLSCHSASYMRYNRMGEDLGLSDELVRENLMFAADKTGELMKSAMTAEDAKKWFGTAPPDLSLVTRSRGPEWFYTYMRSFYRDEKSSTGWNNIVFQHVAMPHVLYELQGLQRAVYRTEKHESESVKDGKKVKRVDEEQVFDRFEIEKPGSMTTQQYDESMRDLTNFMVYVGEPAKLVRYRIGVSVLIFLAIFFVVAYLLKKEYWKDVH
jgi:ubiquinol-cytochrome c reductase cytochrome c1 subunit